MAETSSEPAKNQNHAMVFGLLAVLMWSTVATAFRITLRHTSVAPMLLIASSTAAVVLGIFIVASGRLSALFSQSRRFYFAALALGALNPFLYYLVLFSAYDLLPAQEAQALNYTWAITFALLAVPVLGQRIALKEALSIFTSYFGVYIISTQGDLLGFHVASPLGVTLALGSTLLWSTYWLVSMGSRGDPVLGLFLNFLSGSVLTGIYVLAAHSHMNLTMPMIVGSIYIGTVEMGITFVLWLFALKRAEKASRISTLIFLSPILSLVFIGTVAHETIRGSTIWGLAFIITGLILQSTFKDSIVSTQNSGK
ncbi:DMT family transporter [Myxococcota bacterium]|nr:DMT family transporter [Myxococcota bacterium]